MNELEQAQDEILVRVIGALAVVAFIIGVTGLFTGFSVGWIIFPVALLAIAGIAFGLRSTGRVVAASQSLILLLVALVVVAFFQADSLNFVVPYFLIPVAIITGWLLTAWLGLVVVAAAFAALAIMGGVIQGGSWIEVRLLAIPFLAATIAALLNFEGKRHMMRLWQRLQDNRAVLKARTRAVMDAQVQTNALQQRLTTLQSELVEVKSQGQEVRGPTSDQQHQLTHLLSVAAHELESRFQELERDIESLAATGGQANSFLPLWQRLDHLKELVINLEEIVQFEQHDVQLNYEAIDLKHFLSNVAATAQSWVHAKDVQIRVDVPDNLPPLQADPVRLRQALFHLLNNAIKATDRGVIELRAESLGQDLRLLVSDPGLGMSPEQANRIFGLSGHLEAHLPQSQQEKSLGLVLTKRLVELHQGRIWATGVSGLGSTFYIDLPFSSLADSVRRREVQPQPATPGLEPLGVAPILPGTPALDVPEELAMRAGLEPEQQPESRVDPVWSPEPPLDSETTISSLRPATLTADSTLTFEEEPALPHLPAFTEFGSNVAPSVVSPATSTPDIDWADGEATQRVRPQPSPLPGYDPHATLASPPGRFVSTPVSRRTGTYVRRFSLILVGLLLVVAGIAGLLAIINGPVESQVGGVPTATIEAPIQRATPSGLEGTGLVSLPSPTPLPSRTPAPTRTKAPLPEPTTAPTVAMTSRLPSTLVGSPTFEPADVSPTSVTRAAVESPSTPTGVPTVSLRPSPTPSPTSTAPASSLNLPGVALTEATTGPQLAFINPERLSRLGSELKPNLEGRIEWSKTGRVIFSAEKTGERDLYVVNGSRGRPIKLTTTLGDDLQPAWSPDGRRIAFSSGRTGNFEIYVMDADGSNLVQLTTSRGFDEWPVWSPDGRQLAFVSDRDGNVELYLMAADGSKVQRLTNDPADDWPAAWSPDGRRLVFASNRDDDWNLYLVTVDNAVTTQLTSAPGDERDPVWSPDGKRIAFAYNAGAGFDLYTLPVPLANRAEVSRSAWTQITATPGDERYPSWRDIGNGQ
jgi:TolB protein